MRSSAGARGTEFADKIVAEIFARTHSLRSDRAFALELFYGVLRNLEPARLLDRASCAPHSVDPGARDLLRLGLYQILLIETAAHAAVYETVAFAHPRARALINAILRRALREKDCPNEGGRQPAAADPFLRPGIPVRKMVAPIRRRGRRRTLPVEQPAARRFTRASTRLRTTASEFLLRYPGSSLLPETHNFVDIARPGRGAESGRLLYSGPKHGDRLRALAAGPGREWCSTPAPRPAAREPISRR